jgi:hypothetical protein
MIKPMDFCADFSTPALGGRLVREPRAAGSSECGHRLGHLTRGGTGSPPRVKELNSLTRETTAKALDEALTDLGLPDAAMCCAGLWWGRRAQGGRTFQGNVPKRLPDRAARLGLSDSVTSVAQESAALRLFVRSRAGRLWHEAEGRQLPAEPPRPRTKISTRKRKQMRRPEEV